MSARLVGDRLPAVGQIVAGGQLRGTERGAERENTEKNLLKL